MLEDFFVVYECVLYYIGYMSCMFLGFRYCSDDCFVIYYFGFMFCLFIMMGNFLFWMVGWWSWWFLLLSN